MTDPDLPEDEVIDPERLDDIRIVLNLAHLGELIAHIATHMTVLREIDPPNYDGEEMKTLAISGWQYCVHMADREHFKASVEGDLEKLDEMLSTMPSTPPPCE